MKYEEILEILAENGIAVENWLQDDYVELPVYTCSTVTMADTLGDVIATAKEQFPLAKWGTPEPIYALSDYNRLARFMEKEELQLQDDQYAILCDFVLLKDLKNKALKQGVNITIGSKKLTCAKDAYEMASSAAELQAMDRCLDNLEYYLIYMTEENYDNKYRDTCMKENVDWILQREEELHQAHIMVAGHNGHLTRNQSTGATFLGRFLAESYGTEYFVIGTDYYKTTCNMPVNGERQNEKFVSGDVLAYQVKRMEGNQYYLDFNKVKESQELWGVVNASMPTGSLGEGYSPMMKFIPMSNRVYHAPTAMFDAMILVYEATPITVWE